MGFFEDQNKNNNDEEKEINDLIGKEPENIFPKIDYKNYYDKIEQVILNAIDNEDDLEELQRLKDMLMRNQESRERKNKEKKSIIYFLTSSEYNNQVSKVKEFIDECENSYFAKELIANHEYNFYLAKINEALDKKDKEKFIYYTNKINEIS